MQTSHEIDDDVGEECPSVGPSTSRETTETAATSQPARPKPSRRRQQQQQQQEKRPLLMRRWLQKLADDGDIPGLVWMDAEHTLLRIPWCHGSRSEWNQDCCALFRAWAEYKGL